MQKSLLILCLIAISLLVKAQDADNWKFSDPDLQISVQAGGTYKCFFGDRYIEPSKSSVFEEYQYDRFTKIHTGGFKGGMLIDLKIIKHLYFSSGILFSYRKDVFENNLDTVIKYGNSATIPNIHNTIEYNYTNYDIELPIMLSYKWKRLHISAGAYFPIFIYRKATYAYVINNFPQTPYWTLTEKTFNGIETPKKIYPSWQISYAIKIKKYSIAPYIGADFGARKSIWLQGGILFSFYNYVRKPKSE